ncbi:MAG: hypothetical protein D6725_18340, partial [Planctomycetota bacterium]
MEQNVFVAFFRDPDAMSSEQHPSDAASPEVDRSEATADEPTREAPRPDEPAVDDAAGETSADAAG